MKESLRVPLMMVALLIGATIANAQQVPDPRVADLVQAGKIRVGLFLPQYIKDPVTGEMKGVWVEIARALAARIGVQVVLLEHPTPPEAVDCLKAGACDLLFLPFDARAANVGDFSPPIFQFDYTLLVPAGSSIRSVADADRPGVRIAAVRNHASTIELSRLLKQAELVYAETPDRTFDLLRTGQADAMASARPTLLELFDPVAWLTGAGGPLRGEHQPDGGSERQGRMARLCQRVRRGGQGFGLGAEGHRPRRPARGPGGPAGKPNAQN